MFDTIIIGGGVAGITLAVYLKRAGKNPVILEKYALGGELNMLETIENYPSENIVSGLELAKKFASAVKRFEIPVKYVEVSDIEILKDHQIVKTTKGDFEGKTTVIACGLAPKKANIKGEDELFGKGVSYCATCDGYFYKNKDVAVISQNGSGIKSAMYLSGICNKVYLVNEGIMPRIALAENIEICYQKPTKIAGDNMVKALECDSRELAVSGVFISLGYAPNLSFLPKQIKTEKGYIITDEKMRTNIPSVYAIGDIRYGSIKQILTAQADAVTCAYDLYTK